MSTKIFKVLDDEWEEIMGIMGEGQLKEFATDQACEINLEELKEVARINGVDVDKDIIELVEKIDKGYQIKTFEEVDKVFEYRYFDYIELEVY